MRTVERILAGLGAFAGLLVAVDTYIVKSRLADALRLPESIPTGFVALMVFAFSATIVVLSIRFTRQNDEPAPTQLLDPGVAELENQVSRQQDEISHLSARLERYEALPSRIVALLATNDLSLSRLSDRLLGDNADINSHEALEAVLGDLVKDRTVVERLGKYRLASRDGMPF